VHNILESSKDPKRIKLTFKRDTQQNYDKICPEKSCNFEKFHALLEILKN
jgi:hypothetical protein